MDRDRERIERAMHVAVETPDAYLNEIASHLIVAGGKRLRPVLAVAGARILGEPASDDVVRGGVACELVHLGSLYHDDVMDEADTRRGVETVNAKWGNLQAILAGDFLLARASEIAASLGTEVAALLARTIGWLCEGQIEELRHTYDPARTEASYLRSIHGKTASLYGTAARIGGIVAGHDRPLVDALTEYGNSFGTVFQIVDDVLDITSTGELLGKPAGHDIVEGVYTLPVLRTLQLGTPAARELGDLLGSPLDQAERDKALAIVRANDGLASAVRVAEEYVERAVAACDDFPDSPATDALRAAPRALLASVSVAV
jgi:heptaprenyl diphosphate synthase